MMAGWTGAAPNAWKKVSWEKGRDCSALWENSSWGDGIGGGWVIPAAIRRKS